MLEIRGLRKAFGSLVAVNDVSFTIARGLTTFGILMMVMLGGAWVPMFLFPSWLQNVTLVVPVRWAVDGLDALLGFAGVFGAVALSRFRWEEA
jgi:ABC-2 type transport system permease protein